MNIADFEDEFEDIEDEFMSQWVSTTDAAEIKQVGLTAHRIAELAHDGKISAYKPGEKGWLVEVVRSNEGRYILVPRKPGEEAVEDQPRPDAGNSGSANGDLDILHSPQVETLKADLDPYVEQIDPLVGKGQEELPIEIRKLIKQWLVEITTPEIFQVYMDFSGRILPEDNPLAQGVKEHLPLQSLWEYYDDGKKRGSHIFMRARNCESKLDNRGELRGQK